MKSFFSVLCVLAVTASTEAFWVMKMKNVLVTERVDPVSSPGSISPYVQTITGGSNFGPRATTQELRASKCTSGPIVEDKSNYWTPTLYFQWANGSYSSVDGTVSVKYIFNPGEPTPFPDDFKMLAGTPISRSQQQDEFLDIALDETYLCLSPRTQSSRHDTLPALRCNGGLRSQITFPSCWDGKNLDSHDHRSHVAYATDGKCKDPAFPVTLPQIQVEVHWETGNFYPLTRQALNPKQPFVFSNGDATGYKFYATFLNGWDTKVLKQAVKKCTCGMYGDIKCCAAAGIFTVDTTSQCRITPHVKEQVQGVLSQLPGGEVDSKPGSQNPIAVPLLTNDVTVWTQPVTERRPNWHRMIRRHS